MKQEAKQIAETAAGLAVANATIYTLQDVSLLVSIALGLVSIVWVVAQFAKFVLRWRREEQARSGHRVATDYDQLGK